VRGCVVGVELADGELVIIGDGDDGSGNTPNGETWYRVASITKVATALAVLKLVEGGLDLSQPLTGLVGDAPAAERGACVRQLLCHTSGLPTGWTRDLNPLADSPLKVPPVSGPGPFVYSNLGYDLLGLVISDATRETFAEAIGRLVLAPLRVQAEIGRVPEGRRVAKLHGRDEYLNWKTLPEPIWPSGGLVTTVEGVLRLIKGFGGGGFLDPEVRAKALSDQTGDIEKPERPIDPAPPWGLGVELKGQKSRTWTASAATSSSYGHYGGSGCLAWHEPTINVSWAILGTKTVGRDHEDDKDGWAIDCWNDISSTILPVDMR